LLVRRLSRCLHKSALCAVTVVWLLLPCNSALAKSAQSSPPPPPSDFGAYTEPAPKAPKIKHAVEFVDKILQRRDVNAHVTSEKLRIGTSFGRPTPRPSESIDHPMTLDSRLFERAGIDSPVDQRTSGTLLAGLVAALFAAVGVSIEAATRLGKRRASISHGG
jgi:hypothetical protein